MRLPRFVVPIAALVLTLGAPGLLAQAAKGPEDLSPAHRRALVAIRNGDQTGLETELDAGLDPNLVDWEGSPMLLWALDANQPEMIKELARRGADLSWQSETANNGYLHICIYRDRSAMLEAFLDAGMDVDAAGGKNDKGQALKASPLVIACNQGKMGLVRLLVRRNANLNFVDALDGTPIFRAREKDHEDIARYLEGLGATDVPDTARKNPLRVGDKAPGAPTPGATSSTGNSGSSGSNGGGSGGSSSSGSGGTGRPRAPSSTLLGTDSLPIPPRAPRPIYEVNVGNVLGGPLSDLWAEFSSKHADWGLDANGHKTNLGPGVTMTGGSRIDQLPTDWASEIYTIGTGRGMVPDNPEAKALVAPRGGYAIVAAQEDQARQAEAQRATAERDAARAAAQAEEDEAARQESTTTDDGSASSQASGRPGS